MLCLAWAIAPPGNVPMKHHGYTVVFLRAWHWVADGTGLVCGGGWLRTAWGLSAEFDK